MHDVLTSLSAQPGEDSNELYWAISIASARLDAFGGKLDRIIARRSHGTSPTLPGISPTLPTTTPAS